MKIRHLIAVALLSAVALARLSAQPAGPKGTPNPPPPDVVDVSYGPHQRNTLDLWKAKSEHPAPLVIYIYGGGFLIGDKKEVSKLLVETCLRQGISVAAINYRYSTQAVYPAPMLDGAHAVQFLRLHAREYNLNPKAFAATGGSAGGGISLWIGFHDDMADPESNDPMLRQSTRLSSMAVNGAQTSYDPRFIAKLISEDTGRTGALRPLFGVKPGEDVFQAKELFQLYEDASPVNHLSADDPPVFMYYPKSNTPLPAARGDIHHPGFGYFLKERMDKLGIECIVKVKEDYEGKPPDQSQLDIIQFMARHFPVQQ
jgi:acetyl esterase